MGGVHATRHTACYMSINMLRLQIRRHLVLIHVMLHVPASCTMTCRASVDTQLARQLTPRPDSCIETPRASRFICAISILPTPDSELASTLIHFLTFPLVLNPSLNFLNSHASLILDSSPQSLYSVLPLLLECLLQGLQTRLHISSVKRSLDHLLIVALP
ncbi:hypothetical protein YC2023_084144 [Brassica napus]